MVFVFGKKASNGKLSGTIIFVIGFYMTRERYHKTLLLGSRGPKYIILNNITHLIQNTGHQL